MALKVTKMDVWSAEITDQPGGLAACLETIAATGANIECLIGRRQPDKPGTGLIFLTPLKGKKVQVAAAAAGFRTSQRIATLKVEGDDRPGLGAKIARTVGDAGVSMRGTSAMVIGRKFACYLGFDDAEAAQRAAAAIKALNRKSH
jgi:hypothetical protein